MKFGENDIFLGVMLLVLLSCFVALIIVLIADKQKEAELREQFLDQVVIIGGTQEGICVDIANEASLYVLLGSPAKPVRVRVRIQDVVLKKPVYPGPEK